MIQLQNYFPGQQATIFLEIKDGYGSRIDGYQLPIVERIIFPLLTVGVGYPQPMIKIDTGLYCYKFILPIGAISIGSYLVDVSYIDAISNLTINVAYQINISAPFGNYGVMTTV